MSRRARLFVALDLPGETRAGIEAWGQRQLADPALRPVREESLHVTLAFLGYRPEAEIEPIADAVRESGTPAPWVELLDPVPRPSRRPGLFALPVRSPETEALQAGLRERLLIGGLCQPERRPFWPHVTVARVRTEGRGSRRPQRVESSPGALSAGLSRPFRAVRMTFYRSELQSGGSRYVPLAQVELSADGRQ